MPDYLRRLFRYDHWANRETLRALEAAGAPTRSLQLMAHIIAAQWLWLKRMGHGKALAVWPELTLGDCFSEEEELATAWQAFLAPQTPLSLRTTAEYTNSKGESWTNTREDILMHVVLHSAYHRGQIAADLRAQGFSPAYTDFIEAVRRGELE